MNTQVCGNYSNHYSNQKYINVFCHKICHITCAYVKLDKHKSKMCYHLHFCFRSTVWRRDENIKA
jgi:hypothetical protein